MKKKTIIALVLIFTIIISLVSISYYNNHKLFWGLEPKATYNGYKIFDIVEQRGLACAEAIEILDSDDKYSYYFPCLKSSRIYFVKNHEVINVHKAYKEGIITLQKLYELKIVDRMEKVNLWRRKLY